MKRVCQGYCGGYVKVFDIRIINGEQFCSDCAEAYEEMERAAKEKYGFDSSEEE